MTDLTEYIQQSKVRCRAHSILYHKKSRIWSWVHWCTGIFNSLVAIIVTILSFVSERQGWSNTETGIVGGLILTASTSLITALQAGQNQKQNEEAGDAYRNLEDKIATKFLTAQTDEQKRSLLNYCCKRLEKLTNKYNNPNPDKFRQLTDQLLRKLQKQNLETQTLP
jgi:ABC-type transport system involved in cytochrome bd biosynthesis fused ATPase/permease subunit